MSINEIMKEAESLPVEERVLIVDRLLRSLNSGDLDIEEEWLKVAKRRLSELRFGKAKLVPGEEVFAKIRARLNL